MDEDEFDGCLVDNINRRKLIFVRSIFSHNSRAVNRESFAYDREVAGGRDEGECAKVVRCNGAESVPGCTAPRPSPRFLQRFDSEPLRRRYVSSSTHWFFHSLTHSLAPHCALRPHTPSLVEQLTIFMAQFHGVLPYCAQFASLPSSISAACVPALPSADVCVPAPCHFIHLRPCPFPLPMFASLPPDTPVVCVPAPSFSQCLRPCPLPLLTFASLPLPSADVCVSALCHFRCLRPWSFFDVCVPAPCCARSQPRRGIHWFSLRSLAPDFLPASGEGSGRRAEGVVLVAHGDEMSQNRCMEY